MPLVRRTDDYFWSWLGASFAGSAVSLIAGPAVLANDLNSFAALVGLAVVMSPFVLFWIAPVWLVGVGAVAVPVWIALQRLERDTVLAGLLLGATTAGAAWAAGSYALSQSSYDANIVLATAKALIGGAVTGGIAGWVGWRFSRRRAPEPAA